MAAGDLGGDGQLEFVVGLNCGGGIHLLSADGKVLWKQPDVNVRRVAVVDIDGDERPEILHNNSPPSQP